MSQDLIQQTKAQKVFMEWTLDILIYTTVLNVFVHFVDDFFVENFMYSIGTAIVLKITLVIVLRFEHAVRDWFDARKGKLFRVLKPLSIWAILFSSKFLILEVVDIIFGHKVDLHNIIALIAMVIVLIVAREGLMLVYRKLGEQS